MYEKIICKNGEVILLSNVGKKISDINDLNLIDITNIENEVEQIEQEETRYLLNSKKCQRSLKFYKIFNIIISLLLIIGLSTIFIIKSYIMLFLLSVLLIDLGCITLCKKITANELESNKLIIDKLNNHKSLLLEKKKKFNLNPTFSPIREGQEFELKDVKDLGNALKLLKIYYKNKKLVNKSYKDTDNLKELIVERFTPLFVEYKIAEDYRNIVIEAVYEEITNERKDMKRKIKHR